ncbi:hypothetical protein [Clavibacter michiganensis]|uniref:hypothetical protein n=1 Tax=Clavibacter michiganensis TaxID=28447 RepID=UPI0015E1DBB3|nr:hypothetical protein [Clavibacter michiganensis]
MKVLLHGVIVDGPVLADVEGAITATFTCAESTGGGSFAPLPASCDVVCRGALAVGVLLGLGAGNDVCVAGELRLHRPPAGFDEDLVLASVEAYGVTVRGAGSCVTRIGHAASDICF